MVEDQTRRTGDGPEAASPSARGASGRRRGELRTARLSLTDQAGKEQLLQAARMPRTHRPRPWWASATRSSAASAPSRRMPARWRRWP